MGATDGHILWWHPPRAGALGNYSTWGACAERGTLPAWRDSGAGLFGAPDILGDPPLELVLAAESAPMPGKFPCGVTHPSPLILYRIFPFPPPFCFLLPGRGEPRRPAAGYEEATWKTDLATPPPEEEASSRRFSQFLRAALERASLLSPGARIRPVALCTHDLHAPTCRSQVHFPQPHNRSLERRYDGLFEEPRA